MKTCSDRENTSLQDPYVPREFILTHDLGWSFSLDPLRLVLTIYPYLVNFLIFTNFHISPEWCHIICFVIIGNVSYQFAINYGILWLHICYFIIHAMSSLPLSFFWLILSSFFHHVLGYSFVITKLLLTSMTTIIHIANN